MKWHCVAPLLLPTTAVAQCLEFSSPAVANGAVHAFATYDDGSGPALFVTGDFTNIGGTPASGIAKWDGAQWSALGLGLTGGWGTRGRALCVYDDGSGPVLVVGGAFDNAGGIPSGGVAAWNGVTWSAFGSGFGNSDPLFGNSRRVEALAVYGGQLYAGGYFNFPAHIFARWDGNAWTAVPAWLWNCEEYEEAVFAFQVFDDGTGPALYAGGSFIFGGSSNASAVVRWNGTQLSAVGNLFGLNCPGAVLALEADADSVANGGRLYAGGALMSASSVAAWDGASWQTLGSTFSETIALETFDDGTGDGASLYADVKLQTGDPPRLARWDGAAWQNVGGAAPAQAPIQCLQAFDDSGDGADLWIGGFVTSIGGVPVQRIAKYTGCGALGEIYCFGDGSLPTPCPCSAPDTVPIPGGAPGAGCANSFNLGGATLSAVGATTPDTARFVARIGGNYAGFGFLLKGTAADLAGVASHDGIRCVSGALLRVGAHNAGTYGAPLGTWTYPNTVQTLPVHVVTAQQYGQDAHYQLFYRNAVPGFCTAATANFSNAVRIGWH
jgi:hypothetical protein